MYQDCYVLSFLSIPHFQQCVLRLIHGDLYDLVGNYDMQSCTFLGLCLFQLSTSDDPSARPAQSSLQIKTAGYLGDRHADSLNCPSDTHSNVSFPPSFFPFLFFLLGAGVMSSSTAHEVFLHFLVLRHTSYCRDISLAGA